MAVCSPLTHPHICYDWKLIAIISTLHFSIQSFQHWKWWVCRTNEPSRRQESQLELQLQRRRLECCRRYERPIDLHLALWQLSYVRVLCSFIAYPFRFVFPNLLDHILATAATNGAVVTWNLNKSSRSKQGTFWGTSTWFFFGCSNVFCFEFLSVSRYSVSRPQKDGQQSLFPSLWGFYSFEWLSGWHYEMLRHSQTRGSEHFS